MNIEIANRLFELRKQKNLSQEELAEKIGVSRQAVSKWERAESSPDTNNLIELARLYEISLDELLFTTEPLPHEKAKEEKKEFVSIGFNGIHVVEKDGSEVHIGLKGIHVKNTDNPDFDEEVMQTWEETKENLKNRFLNSLPVPLVVTIAYLIIGFLFDLWHPGWVIFFAIPIYYEIVSMITADTVKKKLNLLPVALLSVLVYLILGFCYNLWHPAWIIFLFIPLYYSLVHAIFKNKENSKDT